MHGLFRIRFILDACLTSIFPKLKHFKTIKKVKYGKSHWSLLLTIRLFASHLPFCPTRYYDPRYITREQGQLLSIPRVRETDNGEYCCLASNGIGEAAKSCGALQLKMSMFAFCQKLSGCSLDNLDLESRFFLRIWRWYKLQKLYLCLSCLVGLFIRATDQTPSYQSDPSDRIQSSASLRYPRQPQAGCHLAQRWWAHQSMHILSRTGNGCRLCIDIKEPKCPIFWLGCLCPIDSDTNNGIQMLRKQFYL